MNKRWLFLALALCLLLGLAGPALADEKTDINKLPVKNMVTLVDLGADYCMPCRLMLPVLKELKRDYKGRAAIVFLDINEHPKAARKFRIRAIPTQIFYDSKGKEVGRHEGYLDKETIVKVLAQLGVKPSTP